MVKLVSSLGAVGLAAAVVTAAAAQTTDRPSATPAKPLPGATAPPLPAQTPQPSPTPMPSTAPENPLITQQVSQQLAAWRRGRLTYAQYEPNAGGTYMPAYVGVVQPQLQAIGPIQSLAYRSASLLLGDLVYRYDAIGTNGSLGVLYAIDQNGKIADFDFTPLVFRVAQVPPPGQPNPIPTQPGALPSPMPITTPIPPATPMASPSASPSPLPSSSASPMP